jgi:hypothetical protein
MPAHERYARPLAIEPGRIIRDIDEPIKVGSMLWVFTDPDRGHEFAYNRWYERDHYYGGCMIGEYHFAGSRWVATRAHKDARFPTESPMPFPIGAGSYACLYWYLAGHHDEVLDWATPQVHRLYAEDRGFAHRTHYNTATFGHAWRAYRDPDPVPLELALDHRYPGMVSLFVDLASGRTQTQLDAWFDAYLPQWLPGSPIATVAHWTNIPVRSDKPDFTPVDPAGQSRSLQVHFVEDDPLAYWEHEHRLADALAASGLATVAFAAPFVATVIGTDRYVDELW